MTSIRTGPSGPAAASTCASDCTLHSCFIQQTNGALHAVCSSGRHLQPAIQPDASYGTGSDIAEAISQALHRGVLHFASLADDRQACVAALRGHTLRIRLHRRRIHVIEHAAFTHRPAPARRHHHSTRHRSKRYGQPRPTHTTAIAARSA